MGYNRFYLSIVLNCLLIFAAAFLFFYFLNIRNQPSTAVGTAVLAFLLVLRLIFYVNRTNRILGNFLIHMHENDPSLSYTVKYADKNFRGLNNSLERLIRDLKESRADLEVQAHYLEAILANVSTGILCFDSKGQIQTINKAASDCLGINSISNLKNLEEYHPGLGSELMHMTSNEQAIKTINLAGKTIQLSLNSSQIKLKSETVFIIALNDISNQMEEQEIRSWKKLIRVINHEIMNSMTPIITLSTAIRNKLTRIKTTEALEDAVQSAGIIKERSAGLVSFIERYKKLTGIPPMNMVRFPARELFASIEQFFNENLSEKGIRLTVQSDCNVEFEADRQMMEQVLINLVKNSIEAVKNRPDPKIELFCYPQPNGLIRISIRDNGEGIQSDKLEQVFVPFFTTREEGSGIGLSLCRQIIRLHHGTIQIESVPGVGTTVILRF